MWTGGLFFLVEWVASNEKRQFFCGEGWKSDGAMKHIGSMWHCGVDVVAE